jgi:glycosyltransferase involved in cell wall biosynthesis
MPPIVSVVIPCFRGSRFLAQAIESCLNQTHRDLEVLVVDDASPENDAEIAESYATRDSRVRVFRHAKNGGVSRSYNTGFAAAHGEFLTRLSQDDMYREDAFEIMVRHLQAAPQEVGLVYCDMQKVDQAGRYLSTWYQSPDPKNALFPTQEVGLCVMWRRIVYETVGPFRPLFDFAEDYDFYLRVSRRFRLAKCGEEAPLFFRCHPDQNGAVSEMKQAVSYALAQTAHHWATITDHPLNVRPWKGVLGGTARVVRWSWKSRRAAVHGREKG